MLPEQRFAAEVGLRLADEDHHHPGEGDQRGADRARPDRLAQEHRGEEQGDQRRDEGQRDRLRQRHARQAPEEQQRHHRGQRAAEQMEPHRRAATASWGGDGEQARPPWPTPTSIRHSIVG